MNNFEWALTDKYEHRPRNRIEQRVIWEGKLKEELELEESAIEALEIDSKLLHLELFYFSPHINEGKAERLQKVLCLRSEGLDLLFLFMHRVAYFEHLLKFGLDEELLYESD